MIARAIDLRDAISRFLENDEFKDVRKYQLSAHEWDALISCRNILEIPHAFQQILSFESTPTLGDAIPAYEAMANAWKKYQTANPLLAPIVEAGLEKLGGYRDRAEVVPAYTLAMLVNPAEKLTWYYDNNMPHKAQKAKELFIQELKVYRTASPLAHPAQAVNPPTPNRRDRAHNILGMGRRHVQPVERSVETEVELYLADSSAASTSLLYWQENSARYPTIFKLAMDILPIQSSAVPCKRVFSSAKETMTARRNRIGPELMTSLQILKFSIKKGRPLNFTSGLNCEAELDVLESIMDWRAV